MTTVFDVADAILERSDRNRISTIKLQKLVFYTFGWYGMVTGRLLFEDPIYAMPKGPVVGTLLSAHQGQRSLTLDELHESASFTSAQDDALLDSVVDAVMATYGKFGPWDLVEMTHQESPWEDAWAYAEKTGSSRVDLDPSTVLEFFEAKFSNTYTLENGEKVVVPIRSFLPDSESRLLDEESLSRMEASDQLVQPDAFKNVTAEMLSVLRAF